MMCHTKHDSFKRVFNKVWVYGPAQLAQNRAHFVRVAHLQCV